MTKPDFTEIIVVLDRSASMQSCTMGTIAGFNEFLSLQQKTPGQCALTLIQFSGPFDYITLINRQDIHTVAPLNPISYQPNGYSTALNDAVGRAIDEVGARLSSTPEWLRPSQVVFCIITDGLENDSRIFSYTTVREKIEHQRIKYNWVFQYMGANHDVFAVAKDIGIPLQFAASYNSTDVGAKTAFLVNAVKTRNYRSSGDVSDMEYNNTDRSEYYDKHGTSVGALNDLPTSTKRDMLRLFDKGIRYLEKELKNRD